MAQQADLTAVVEVCYRAGACIGSCIDGLSKIAGVVGE
jgi:hypothetical protein